MADRAPRSDAARALLNAYRRVNTPTDADRERVWTALQEHEASESRPRPSVVIWVAAASVAAAIGLGWWIADGRRSAAERSGGRFDAAVDQRTADPDVEAIESKTSVRRPDPVDATDSSAAPEPVGAPPSPNDDPEPAAVRTTPAKPPRGRSAPTEPADELEAEMGLIRAAERMLEAGDHPRALALLEQHAERFPGGKLGLERDALRVLTLCKAGKRPQGRGEATILLRRDPHSPYRERIRSACDD